ncbi:MAG: protein disulfide isomerase family protein [Candidatus Bathyarchaeia archaeon]
MLYGENEQEIEEQLKSKDQTFVLFYESWCPFSQRFLPVFNKFAESQNKDCVKIVADYKINLCDKFGVEVFPTVLFFEKGQVTKRLDGKPSEGLNQQKLDEFAKKC